MSKSEKQIACGKGRKKRLCAVEGNLQLLQDLSEGEFDGGELSDFSDEETEPPWKKPNDPLTESTGWEGSYADNIL